MRSPRHRDTLAFGARGWARSTGQHAVCVGLLAMVGVLGACAPPAQPPAAAPEDSPGPDDTDRLAWGEDPGAGSGPSEVPLGAEIGRLCDVPVYYNQEPNLCLGKPCFSAGTEGDFGLLRQCTEFAARFACQVFLGCTKKVNSYGNAAQWFAGPYAFSSNILGQIPRERRYPNGALEVPRPGDIITFSTASTGSGHVAIVRSVDRQMGRLVTIDQNNTAVAEHAHPLLLSKSGSFSVPGAIGWMRPSGGVLPTCLGGTDTAQYPLTVSKGDSGTGVVTASAGALRCDTACSTSTTSLVSGTQVTLSVIADAGSTFVGWSGACQGNAPTCVVTITGPTQVQASFHRTPLPPGPCGSDAPNITWRARAPLSEGDTFWAAAVHLGQVHLFGTSFYLRHRVYDPTQNLWAEKAWSPISLHDTAVVSLGGTLYGVGDGTPSNNGAFPGSAAARWEAGSDRWTALADNPWPRRAATAAVLNGKVYLAGGASAAGTTARVNAYDPQANAWVDRAALPAPGAGLPSVVYGGRWYVFGASAAALQPQRVQMYDPNANAWTPLGATPSIEAQSACAVLQGSTVWLLGGRAGSGAVVSTTALYDIPSGSLCTGPNLPEPLYQAACQIIDNRIYLAGGYTDSNGNLSAHVWEGTIQ